MQQNDGDFLRTIQRVILQSTEQQGGEEDEEDEG